MATPEPLFVADDVALDFINTAYGVEPNQVDCLASDQAVLDWLTRAGLTQELESVPSIGKKGALMQAALDLRADARESIERRKAGAVADVSTLNHVLALGDVHRQVTWRKGQRPEFRLHRKAANAEALLTPLAEAIATLLVDGDFDLVRQCESSDCTLWFYDRTKSHHRRWCSMASCGNRAKVAAFRERQKGG